MTQLNGRPKLIKLKLSLARLGAGGGGRRRGRRAAEGGALAAVGLARREGGAVRGQRAAARRLPAPAARLLLLHVQLDAGALALAGEEQRLRTGGHL